VALEILIRVETKGRHPDDVLDEAFKKYRSLTDLDRAFVTELVYGTLRWRGKIDWVIARFSRIKFDRIERIILYILRLGVYQLLFLTKTPDRAAVNESVILAKRLKSQDAAGFVNAVLRRIIREGGMDGLPVAKGSPQDVLAVEQAFPLWAVIKLWNGWGEKETRAFCEASNRPAPLVLRVNTLAMDREDLISRLRREGLSACATRFSPNGVVIEDGRPVPKMPFLRSGYYQIQDEAAQLISFLVDPKPGERVLDVCAAPGTKTTHLAQLMANRGSIYALDINGAGLAKLRQSCQRMGVTNVTVLKRDLTQPVSLPRIEPFDAVLVDVPCTGWGTIRRNPDIKWRTGPDDIPRMASLQRRILDNAAALARRGGRVIYSTCTVYHEENEGVVEGFLGSREDFLLDRDRPGLFREELFDERGFFRTLPHRHNTDGFFAARLVRE